MDPQFRVLVAFAEVLGIVPNACMVAHSCLELQLWGFSVFFLASMGTCMHTMQTHRALTHTQKHLYN